MKNGYAYETSDGVYFDVEKFPTSTFSMTQVNETGSGAYEISGNFTLHGITKNISC